MPASSVLEAKTISTGAMLPTGASAALGRFRAGSGACAETSCEDPSEWEDISDTRVFWMLSSAGSLFSRIAEEPGGFRAAHSCFARCKVSIRSSAD